MQSVGNVRSTGPASGIAGIDLNLATAAWLDRAEGINGDGIGIGGTDQVNFAVVRVISQSFSAAGDTLREAENQF